MKRPVFTREYPPRLRGKKNDSVSVGNKPLISFFSTFPPVVCGIADYTRYLVSQMPKESWRVTSFNIDGSFAAREAFSFKGRVSYELSLNDLYLPFSLGGDVAWFQHTFGIWGKDPLCFVRFLEDAKEKDKKVVASFHTVHFESPETESGLRWEEEEFLAKVLPLLDAATVFTEGAYRAVVRRFPQHQDRVVLLRHGVHLYPRWGQKRAKETLVRYLMRRPHIPLQKKRDLHRVYHHFFSPRTVTLGTVGFVSASKALSDLHRLREAVQKRLPRHRVLSLVIGSPRLAEDKTKVKYTRILRELESLHDGETNLFFEHYLAEDLLPIAFKALDFSVFWCTSATQSGRISHAQGAGACIIGRKLEGVGETLELSGLPTGRTLEELADIIQKFTLHPELKEKALTSSRRYAHAYCYRAQARKHLLLAKSLLADRKLPLLDLVPRAERSRLESD